MNQNIPSSLKNPNTGSPIRSDAPSHFALDYKKLLLDLLRFWWLFVIAVMVALFIVQMKHRYAQPVYRASLTLLMEERGTEKPQSNMMEGFGLSSAMRAVENQIAILRSWENIRQAIDELDFNVSYFRTGRVKNTEIYGSLPFKVHFDSFTPQLLNTPIYLSVVDAQHYRLHINTEHGVTYNFANGRTGNAIGRIDLSETYRFNEWISLPWLKIKIENQELSRPEERSYFFQFNNPDAITSHYQALLHAPKPADNTSIVRMFVTGHNTPKNLAFLNKVAEVFIRNNLERKNQIATNTIQFIETQLIAISDSLSVKGDELSQFRTTHQIQSVSTQAEILFSRLENLADQKTQQLLTKRYYQYLTDYFSGDTIAKGTLAPAVYPISNSMITNYITRIMELNLELQTLQQSVNPYYEDIESKIEVARQTLLKAISNQMELIDTEIARIDQLRQENTSQLYLLPEKERQLFGIERQFDLNNEVYTFLLRKRSEAQIQKASNTPDHSILEAARFAGMVSSTINSDRQKAIMIALMFPAIFILLKQLLNNKISGTEDVERITRLPIIGHIIHNQKKETNVVHNHPKSVITETFRRIRSRLEYLTGDTACPIIAISSSMPGEGKTFCALNLASVFAISGKKTILLGFDMRKPGLNKVLDIKREDGVSSYLIGKSPLESLIYATETENLFILPSGAIPPNPSELISSKKNRTAF